MFTPVVPLDNPITMFWNDQPVEARLNESVAACLLRTGVGFFRTTPLSGAPRLPYCMIGHCFECLVEIDGVGNRQACLTPVRDDMRVRSQSGAATVQEQVAE
jgi:D-hydroxyproline dehydrogenase subunit gamma